MELFPFSILYWLSYVLASNGHAVISACPLIVSGIGLYLFYFRKYHSLLAPPAVFSMSWIFCIGIACLKLSNLQTEWEFSTWLSFYLIFVLFVLGFKLGQKPHISPARMEQIQQLSCSVQRLYILVPLFTVISLGSFLTEALLLGFVPLFTVDTPHAYSYFHISGLHYFTVLCVLVPAMGILYLHTAKDRKHLISVIACCFISLLLPILMVSRFQLVFSVLLAIITMLFLNENDCKKFLNPRTLLLLLITCISLLILYVFLTVERAHSIEYLNGIFEMKDPETPIFLTQPYIYVVNNFENFNCLVRDLSEHTHGLKMAFPLFALSGLKFIKPELVSFPLYITKEELTTVTMFYDAYYDFGILGCCFMSGILGFVYSLFYRTIKLGIKSMPVLIYAQLTAYLMLSFFTTWFSNPTAWFYLGVCVVASLFVWYTPKQKKLTLSKKQI